MVGAYIYPNIEVMCLLEFIYIYIICSNSIIVFCDPPCVNGVCVSDETCVCGEEFEGFDCSKPS